jgi:hypothetical protein
VRGVPDSHLGTVGLGLASLFGAVRVALAIAAPLETWSDVSRAVRTEVIDTHEATLVERPDLGLFAVALRPTWNRLALDLLARFPVETILAAGWRPERVPIDSELRIRIARWLERNGRGGEADRVLLADGGPSARWWLALFRRARGWETTEALLVEPAPAVPRFPGFLEIQMASDQPVEIVVQADQPLHTIVIEAWPSVRWVTIQIDTRTQRVHLAGVRGSARLPVDLPRGPHRIWMWLESNDEFLAGRIGGF